jgi:diketogulonate reductase-like aldo/keto reductase
MYNFQILKISSVQVGFALKKLFEEGIVERENLFITSKLWYVRTLILHVATIYSN